MKQNKKTIDRNLFRGIMVYKSPKIRMYRKDELFLADFRVHLFHNLVELLFQNRYDFLVDEQVRFV